jgi:hypothetical protein
VNWVISSPNANWIPTPPGHMRTLRLRTDGKFGFDDPLNWPQPSLPHQEYLACIPTRDRDLASRTWHSTLGSDDIIHIAGESPAFKLALTKSRLLDPARAAWCERVSFFRSKATPNLVKPLENLFQNYNRAYILLCEVAEESRFVQYRWAAFSRWALEITAYLDYYVDFLPRLSRRQKFPLDRTRMGCITRTTELTQEFFQIGLPIWTIRQVSSPEVFRSRMMYSTPPRKRSEVVVSDFAPGHSTLLEVDVWSPKYLGPVHDWARHMPLSGSASVEGQPAPEIEPSRVPTKRKLVSDGDKIVSSKRPALQGVANQGRFTPVCDIHRVLINRTGGRKKAKPDVLLASPALTAEDRSLNFPVLSVGWEHGLRSVKDLAIVDRTFYYPDPDMFRSVQTSNRLKQYVAAWLVVRPHWLAQPKDGLKRPEVSTTRRWKSLFMGFFTKGGDLQDRETKTSQDRLALLQVMGLHEIKPIDPENLEFEWLGKIHQGRLDNLIAPSLVRQVVWELHELNFRQDFLSMHKLHRLDPNEKGEAKLFRKAFPRTGDGSLDELPMDDELGLGDPNALTRAQTFVYLNRIMVWPEMLVPEATLAKATLHSSALMAELEKAVGEAYCGKFWKCTQRKPVPPALWS